MKNNLKYLQKPLWLQSSAHLDFNVSLKPRSTALLGLSCGTSSSHSGPPGILLLCKQHRSLKSSGEPLLSPLEMALTVTNVSPSGQEMKSRGQVLCTGPVCFGGHVSGVGPLQSLHPCGIEGEAWLQTVRVELTSGM